MLHLCADPEYGQRKKRRAGQRAHPPRGVPEAAAPGPAPAAASAPHRGRRPRRELPAAVLFKGWMHPRFQGDEPQRSAEGEAPGMARASQYPSWRPSGDGSTCGGAPHASEPHPAAVGPRTGFHGRLPYEGLQF